MKRLARFALLSLMALPACDREDPTAIGGPLVENGVVRTFEVTLDASQYLVRDTAFSAFAPPATGTIFILANGFEGVLNANGVAKFRVDALLGIPDSAGVVKVDSTPKLQRGRYVLKIDTIASAFTGPVKMSLYELAEDWDTASVTWRVRSMNGTAPVLWATPGGTRGVLLDTATYAGGDSVVFRVDTLTLARWRNPANVNYGTVVTVQSPNTRLRTARPLLRIDFRTTFGDTIITQTNTPFAARYIFDPSPAAASSDIRVGGAPTAYRSVLELRADLADIRVACPFTAGCTVRLKDANIARADILLEPIASQAGYTPELPVTVLGYSLLPTAQLPLVRSPLGSNADPLAFVSVAPSSFRAATVPVAPLRITQFVRDLVAPIDTVTFKSRYLSLLQGSTATFGYGTFRANPRLRLRLSVAQEIQLP